MKSAKKITSLLLALVMIFACFAGCSSSDVSEPATQESDTAGTTEAKNTEKVKVIDIELSDEEYALGVDKDQPELLKSVNSLINEMMQDGSFDEICNHYFGDGEPVGVSSAAEDTSKDQLVVATNAEFEPFEYKQGDLFYGIDMEVVKAIADKLGMELVIKDMKFEAVVLSVQQHKADIAAAGLTVNEKRAEQVDFTDSYYSAAQKLIVKTDDTLFDSCQTKDDVDDILETFDSNVKIGGQNGTTGQAYVEGSEDFDFDGLDATFVGYDNGSLAVQDLINGGVDYVIIDAAPAVAITTAINAVA